MLRCSLMRLFFGGALLWGLIITYSFVKLQSGPALQQHEHHERQPYGHLRMRAAERGRETTRWNWTPAWSGRAPGDRQGLASEAWRALRGEAAAPARRPPANASASHAARLLLRAAAARNATLSLVQVGACDGAWEQTNDPVQELLRDPRVRALAMEPVPYLWKELDRRLSTLQGAGLRLLAKNAALCLEPKDSAPFYVVSPRFAAERPDAQHWAKRELGSFKRSHLLKHSIPSQYIDVIQVPCLSPPQLFQIEGSPVGTQPSAVDVLVVDAEGLDADLVEALHGIDGLRPALIIFEQKHVARKRLSEVLDGLKLRGYVHWQDHDQIVALLAAPPRT